MSVRGIPARHIRLRNAGRPDEALDPVLGRGRSRIPCGREVGGSREYTMRRIGTAKLLARMSTTSWLSTEAKLELCRLNVRPSPPRITWANELFRRMR